jgi:hypothetical protein
MKESSCSNDFFQGTMPTSLGRLEPVSIDEQERVQELANYVRNRD